MTTTTPRRGTVVGSPCVVGMGQFGTPLTVDTTSTLSAINVGPAADRHGTTVDDMGAPGPSADADDLEPASNPTGLSADSSGAPSEAATGATRWGMTMFWRWAPTTSTATSRIRWATAQRATNPWPFDRGERRPTGSPEMLDAVN
jgi:hypothetical protein